MSRAAPGQRYFDTREGQRVEAAGGVGESEA